MKELRRLGRHYHQLLHEVELGPRRAERLKLYRDLDRLRSELSTLPKPLRSAITTALEELGASSATAGADRSIQVSFADQAGVAALAEAAARVAARHRATSREASEHLPRFRTAARRAAKRLAEIDPRTWQMLISDSAFAPLRADEIHGAGAIPTILERLDSLWRRAYYLFITGRRLRGREPRVAVPWITWSLCRLWQRETGHPATSSAGPDGAYAGTPQSPTGQFVMAAVIAFTPSDEWRKAHAGREGPSRTHVWDPGALKRAVHRAMREYVALQPVTPGRRGPRRRTR